MIVLEDMGKPAVPIVSGRFENDALASARTYGMPGIQYVVVPRIYRNLTPEESTENTIPAFDDIVRMLTTNASTESDQDDHSVSELQRFEGDDKFDAVLRMNEEYLLRDLGDAFPLLPPTREAVDALIAGTRLRHDRVVCDMPPGFGIATVEKIAINAAMAGAKPEHMPVIIAAVKATSQIGGQGGKALLMSTSPNAPLLMVNGPIAKELGINGKSALGPGYENRVNITIGRAFSLCLRNIGQWYPGEMDMDTIGTTRKFVLCVAENEAMSPWEPYHVEKGFALEESTITIFITDGELDVQDQGNDTAEGLLKTLAYGVSFGTRSIQGQHTAERLIFMPPDVAGPIGARGFSKRGAKEFIHTFANRSLGKMIQYMPLKGEARVAPQWKWLEGLTEDQLLNITMPVVENPDRYDIVVVGADRAKTLVMPTGPSSVTVGINEYRPREGSRKLRG